VVSALALVLGVLAVLAYLARRVAPRVGATRGPGGIHVVARTGLAPRQGIATVRVSGRLLLVSYGEGGVRLLSDLANASPEAAAPAPPPAMEAGAAADGQRVPRAFARALAVAGRRMARLRAVSLALALALGTLAAAPPMPVAAWQGTPPSEGKHVEEEASAAAPSLPGISLSLGGADGRPLELSGPVGTVVFVGFLTLIPTLLLLMTSFTRILIVLHLLKQALGTQTAPPAHLLAAMALLLTGFVMAPTFQRVNRTALAPWMDGKMDEVHMLKAAAVPMRSFMLGATREQDLAQFVEMSGTPKPRTVDDIPLVAVTSAFVTSELTSAFQMGFALFLPFMIIDVVVASVLMSMGMFMLPPVMVSLPFKLLLFVLVDGWSLVVGSLVQSF